MCAGCVARAVCVRGVGEEKQACRVGHRWRGMRKAGRGQGRCRGCESLCGESARWRGVQCTEMHDKEEPAVSVLPGEETLGQGPTRSKGTTLNLISLP